MLIYYVDPGNGTIVFDDSFPYTPPSAPWTLVTQSAYQTELLAIAQATNPEAYGLELLFSRSQYRTNPGKLHLSTLDTGKTYAIYISEVPELGYTQVEFFLDAVSFNVETSAPWDYAGTDGFGNAVTATIPAGLHTIDALVTYPGGSFTIAADFEVN